MNSPTELIAEPDAVVLDLVADSGEAAVGALHARLVESSGGGVVDAPGFLADVRARMRLGPICIADDVALPHARTDAVSRMVFAAARMAMPISFDATHPAVRLIFLIGTPKDSPTGYLQAVALLSRILRDKSKRAGLYAASNDAEFRALLSEGAAARR